MLGPHADWESMSDDEKFIPFEYLKTKQKKNKMKNIVEMAKQKAKAVV